MMLHGIGGAGVRYGGGYMNCGPTCLSMIISNHLGMEFPPSALRVLADEYDSDKWIGQEFASNPGHELFYDEELLNLVGIRCVERVDGYGGDNKEKIDSALASDNQIIIGNALGKNIGYGSIFTVEGHYITLTGYRENGNINIDDPNYYNYISGDEKLVEGFENGFSSDVVKNNVQAYYIFEYEEPTLTKEELEKIVEEAIEKYGK